MNLNKLCRLTTRLSPGLLRSDQPLRSITAERHLSLSRPLNTFEAELFEKGRDKMPKPKRWPKFNELVREPVDINSPTKRRAVYYYCRDNVKYSPKKMWYICSFIRGLTVDEAVKQLTFITSKGAHIAKEVLLEAQEEAVQNGFEFKSNMFVGECFCTKGLVIKGMRKHAFYRMGEIRYFYLHFYVKLVEGPPPKEYYYDPNPKTGEDKLQKFIDDHRSKQIEWTL